MKADDADTAFAGREDLNVVDDACAVFEHFTARRQAECQESKKVLFQLWILSFWTNTRTMTRYK